MIKNTPHSIVVRGEQGCCTLWLGRPQASIDSEVLTEGGKVGKGETEQVWEWRARKGMKERRGQGWGIWGGKEGRGNAEQGSGKGRRGKEWREEAARIGMVLRGGGKEGMGEAEQGWGRGSGGQ